MSDDFVVDEAYSEDDAKEASTGFTNVLPGFYMALIGQLRTTNGQAFGVSLEILSGTRAGEVGKLHDDLIPLANEDWMRDKRNSFACACGLTTREEIAKKAAAGEYAKIDYSQAQGKIMICEIGGFKKEAGPGEKNEGKTSIVFDHMYHPQSAQAAKLEKQYPGLIDRSKLENADPFGGDGQSQQSAPPVTDSGVDADAF